MLTQCEYMGERRELHRSGAQSVDKTNFKHHESKVKSGPRAQNHILQAGRGETINH